MSADFKAALSIVRRWEGGWSDHEHDPGGKTKWGVTLKLLKWLDRDFNGDGMIDGKDLRAMTEAQAEAIYHQRFWMTARCDEMPSGVNAAVFDCAVNQGPGRAAKFIQQAARVTVDGKIGPKTLAAIRSRDREDLLLEFMARRAIHYTSLTIFATFGRGWLRRLLDVHARARSML